MARKKEQGYKPIKIDFEELKRIEDPELFDDLVDAGTRKEEKAKQDSSKQDRAKQNSDKQDRAEQDSSKQDRAEQDSDKQDRAKAKENQDGIKQNASKKDSTRRASSKAGMRTSDTLVADAHYRKTKKKGFGFIKTIMLLLFVAVLGLGGSFGYSLYKEYADVISVEGEALEMVIPQGASSKAIADQLQQEGLIKYTKVFLLKLARSEYEGKLRAGTFTLHQGMCIDDIIKTLATSSGIAAEDMFTVPEGFTAEMIADKLEKEKIMPAEEFLAAVTAAAADWDYASQLPDKKQVYYQMQGYLYPDTYAISEDITGEELVAMMVGEFLDQFDEPRRKEAKALDMTMEEVVLRASLVQKETENPVDYPMIAGVINNRLEQGMRLQFDSTVVYAMTEGRYGVARVLNEDLKLESPYNTYKVDGLPVGPICNPCIEAIDGVLHASEHPYLYFQTDPDKDDGSNVYYETYEEHMATYKKTRKKAKEAEAKKSATDTKKKESENVSAAPAKKSDTTTDSKSD